MPQQRIFAFRAFAAEVLAAPHPYETAHAAASADNWMLEKAANPALFNGRMALFSSLRLDGDTLRGTCHLVDFATFLYWRRFGPNDEAQHCTAHAVPVASDGSLLAVRMGAHTANPSRVYFAAGSFDELDIVDGRLDACRNMQREVKEETGLDLGRTAAEEGWHGWSSNGRTVIFRRYRLDVAADALAQRVRRFVAQEAEPEIDGPVIIAGRGDLCADAIDHMPPIVDWHLANRPIW